MAPPPRSHEALTGMAGSFDKTLNAMRLIKAAGITLVMKGNLTKLNWQEAQAMIDLAGELGANIRFSPIITVKEDGGIAPLEFRLDARDWKRFLRSFDPPTRGNHKARTKEGGNKSVRASMQRWSCHL